MKFSELYKILEKDGWYIERTKKHHIYMHPKKSGRIPVGKHSSEEVKTGMLNGILKLAGLKK
jgi:predicted RNA binding protein YcfA (HicA-like mRNA interferase family)